MNNAPKKPLKLSYTQKEMLKSSIKQVGTNYGKMLKAYAKTSQSKNK
jgi:hypothetical protein